MQLPFTESVAKGDNYLDTARFIELLNVDSPFKLLRHAKKKRPSLSTTKFETSSTFALFSDGPAQVESIDFRLTRSIRKRYTRT